ncbi:MAG TPA: GGDEF domain-containing protein [Streptosporangiaceae bacterium]|nr:GGDEF domain-containing protein [Streptosporangiaceae bacterium]
MSAVQDAIRQRQRGLRRLVRWPWAWPLLAMPLSLIVYVLTVIAVDLALIGWELAETTWRAGDLGLAAALLIAAAICIEAIRRLGQPSGVSRDLLSAWWLPIALLLPPIYALLAPFVVGFALYARGQRATPVYRRVFSSAALGLAGAATSVTFHRAWPQATKVSLGGTPAWLTKPEVVLTAVGCAVLFSLVNTVIVAIAAHLAEPEARVGEILWDKETFLLDLTETCVGILVAITCALSPLLLLVALPPVILLQRSLMHQQLQAAARTDPKTGLLNAAAWQREADAEINRTQRTGAPQNANLSMLLIDVDHFKRVNDTHGHLAGDEVLRSLATELRQQVRDSDIVGRFGGEEFTVLLPRADAAEALAIAERLRRGAGSLSIFAGDARIGVTVSIGVAVYGQHGRDLFELLAAADLALYRAKDKGRNQVCLYGGDEAADPRP